MSLNRYSFCDGNPVLLIDPIGYFGIFALMAIGAGIGAVIGAISSAVSQGSNMSDEEFEFDWKQFASDTIWGAIGGAVSFSPLSGVAMTVASGAVSVGSSLTNELIDDEEGINFVRLGVNSAIDIGIGRLNFDFTCGANVSKELISTNKSIIRNNRRANVKWATEQIDEARKEFNVTFRFKIAEDIFNGFKDMVVDNEVSPYIDKFTSSNEMSTSRK